MPSCSSEGLTVRSFGGNLPAKDRMVIVFLVSARQSGDDTLHSPDGVEAAQIFVQCGMAGYLTSMSRDALDARLSRDVSRVAGIKALLRQRLEEAVKD